MENESVIEILLVEDNAGDVLLTQEAMNETKIEHELNVVSDGEEALNYIFKRNGFESAKTPDFILLDLNLPRKDGREVLLELKTNEETKTIPVVVLTTSTSSDDIQYIYDLHANCYVAKPVDFNQFVNLVKHICNFWFKMVRLPAQVVA